MRRIYKCSGSPDRNRLLPALGSPIPPTPYKSFSKHQHATGKAILCHHRRLKQTNDQKNCQIDIIKYCILLTKINDLNSLLIYCLQQKARGTINNSCCRMSHQLKLGRKILYCMLYRKALQGHRSFMSRHRFFVFFQFPRLFPFRQFPFTFN